MSFFSGFGRLLYWIAFAVGVALRFMFGVLICGVVAGIMFPAYLVGLICWLGGDLGPYKWVLKIINRVARWAMEWTDTPIFSEDWSSDDPGYVPVLLFVLDAVFVFVWWAL